MFQKFCWNCESFILSNIEIKVFFTPNDCTGGLWTVHFIHNIACQYYVCVWLIVNLLPSSISFFVTSRAAVSYDFYIQSCKILCFPYKNSCKGTNIFSKKDAFWVLNIVAILCTYQQYLSLNLSKSKELLQIIIVNIFLLEEFQKILLCVDCCRFMTMNLLNKKVIVLILKEWNISTWVKHFTPRWFYISLSFSQSITSVYHIRVFSMTIV